MLQLFDWTLTLQNEMTVPNKQECNMSSAIPLQTLANFEFVNIEFITNAQTGCCSECAQLAVQQSLHDESSICEEVLSRKSVRLIVFLVDVISTMFCVNVDDVNDAQAE